MPKIRVKPQCFKIKRGGKRIITSINKDTFIQKTLLSYKLKKLDEKLI